MMLSAARPCTCMTSELSLVELSPHIPEQRGPCMLLPVVPDIDGRAPLTPFPRDISIVHVATKSRKSNETGIIALINIACTYHKKRPQHIAGSRLW